MVDENGVNLTSAGLELPGLSLNIGSSESGLVHNTLGGLNPAGRVDNFSNSIRISPGQGG